MASVLESIVRFFTSTTGIIAAVGILLGLIAAILGIIHRINEIRKQSREFRKKEESSVPIRIEIDRSQKSGNLRLANPEIKEFDWRDAKELRFQLINDGEATVVVTSMKLVISHCAPSKKLKMIRPGAPLTVYHYRVNLDPDRTEYEIISPLYTEEKPLFSYKTGEADSFLVTLSSSKAYWYELSIVVQWYDSNNPQEVKMTQSHKLRVEYHIVRPGDMIKFLGQDDIDPTQEPTSQ